MMLTTPMTRRAFGTGAIASAACLAVGCSAERDEAAEGPQELRLVRVNTGMLFNRPAPRT